MRNEILHTAVAAFAWLVLIAACIALSSCASYPIVRQCYEDNPPSPDAGFLNAFGAIGGAFASANAVDRRVAITACLQAHGIE